MCFPFHSNFNFVGDIAAIGESQTEIDEIADYSRSRDVQLSAPRIETPKRRIGDASRHDVDGAFLSDVIKHSFFLSKNLKTRFQFL
jgi:hypothetical protein